MYSFDTVTGRIEIDESLCDDCGNQVCIASCRPRILRLEAGRPQLAIPAPDAKRGKCIECLACELDCQVAGRGAIKIILPIPGLDPAG